MFAFGFPKRLRARAVVETLAHEIASASRQEVRQRTEGGDAFMSEHELRGYVRARAAQSVRSRAAERRQSVAGLSPQDWNTVVARATDHVVNLVVPERSSMHARAAA